MTLFSSIRRKELFVLLLGFLFILSLVYLSHFYAVISLSFVCAYTLNPIVTCLERKKISRNIAVPVVLFVFFLSVGSFFVAAIPAFFSQGKTLYSKVPEFMLQLSNLLSRLSGGKLFLDLGIDLDELFNSMKGSQVVAPLTQVASSLAKSTLGIVSFLLGLLAIPLVSFYLLRDFHTLDDQLLKFIPENFRARFFELKSKFDQVLGGFLRGQLVVSLILAFYYTSLFTLLSIEMGFFLGICAGFLNVVPYLGISIVAVITFLSAFLNEASTHQILTLVFIFLAGIGLEGSFLTPKIVGKRVGLSPLVLILAVLAGGELLGIVGVIIAVPLAAILKVIFEVLLVNQNNV